MMDNNGIHRMPYTYYVASSIVDGRPDAVFRQDADTLISEKYHRGSGWKENSWLNFQLMKGELGVDAICEEEALTIIATLNDRE